MNGSTQEEAGRLGRALPLGRIAGIAIRLDYSWFFIFALILVSLATGYFPHRVPDQPMRGYWLVGGIATVLLFASIVVHELSHAITARLSGIRVSGITLFLFGGVSELEEDAGSPGIELRVALVGPLTSFALAALFWGVHQVLPSNTPRLAEAGVAYLASINAALGVFNLLPGFPLDGGRVLRAIAWWKTGSVQRATRVAAGAGQGVAIGLMILGGIEIFTGGLLAGMWLVFIGLFLRTMAQAGYENMVMVHRLEGITVADAASPEIVTVSPQLSIRELVDTHMLEEGYRAYPVADGDEVLGLVSIADLKGLPAEARDTTTVKERMQPITANMVVSPETPLRAAMRQLASSGRERLLVMRGGELAGMLTRGSIARYLEIRETLGASPPSLNPSAERR